MIFLLVDKDWKVDASPVFTLITTFYSPQRVRVGHKFALRKKIRWINNTDEVVLSQLMIYFENDSA